MATIIIKENSLQAKQLLEYLRTLSYATVIEEPKKSLEEAVKECNAVSVDTFISELHRQVNIHFDENA